MTLFVCEILKWFFVLLFYTFVFTVLNADTFKMNAVEAGFSTASAMSSDVKSLCIINLGIYKPRYVDRPQRQGSYNYGDTLV